MQKIAILDAGSQYGKLIDRRVRELNCYSEIYPIDVELDKIKDASGIIISGGPQSVFTTRAPKPDRLVFDKDIPILGICYGMQLLGYFYNGTVLKNPVREDGQIDITIHPASDLFQGLDPNQKVLLTHGDTIVRCPLNFEVTGRSSNGISAIEHTEKSIYGVQFHPEVDLTENGTKIFQNFLFNICGMKGDYKIEDRLLKAIEEIRQQVGTKPVICLVSGGVDSCVCYKLLEQTVEPSQLFAFHIDTGFMRHEESKQVADALGSFNLKVIDCSEIFLNARTEIDGVMSVKLCETVDPEIKRKIIGDTFMRVATTEIEKLGFGDDYYLCQGTLRPDLIESGNSYASTKADVIKTHHNDTNLVRIKRKEGRIVEPLKDYHKDEVRQLGRILGLSDDIVNRHPFPGPGLAIRILACNGPYKTNEYEDIQDKLTQMISNTVLLPVRSVGVQGDGRTYGYVAGFCSVEDPNWDLLINGMVKDVTNNIHQINRGVYIFKKFTNFTVTPTLLTLDTIELCRKCDHIVNQCFIKKVNKISQVPVILIPVSFDSINKYSVVIRTMITRDFMTGVPAIPGEDFPLEILNQTVDELMKLTGISNVAYDLTSKPPATTEWE